jgi:pyruvate,water dikinase
MSSYIIGFEEIGKMMLATVGGKGANLGELARIEGIQVPDGFCISTEAFKKIMSENPSIKELVDQLSVLKLDDRKEIAGLSHKIRNTIEATTISDDIAREISRFHSRLGEKNAYAVRSSATAEDLPTASFAGQQDTYLNIIGREEILKHISKCWASLFTDRAVIYRIQNGFDHSKVNLSVIIQKMIFPDVAGILFTADPVTSNRKLLSIDASFGLGEALVAGLVNADVYKVQNGKIVDKKISTKKLGIYALKDGGIKKQEIEREKQKIQALTDEQILQLERIGRKIEKHFSHPQDIEWCLSGETFYIVQSRPITTLFPVPEINDPENHVYVSVGHQQMMTDPLKPLGLSFFQLIAARPMPTAGGRMFVDVTKALSFPAGRENLLDLMGQHDPLIKDALETILERGDFIKLSANNQQDLDTIKSGKDMSSSDILALAGNDPAIVADLIEASQNAIEKLKRDIQTKSGPDLFDFILEDIQQSKKMRAESKNLAVILAGANASRWINEKMNEWLGEKNVADKISQSVPNNITSEMGLALLDVADAIRPYPEVIEYLQQTSDDNFLDELPKLNGGNAARDAIIGYLDKYGMRCAGEIDITKTRWSEKPIILVPLILSNIKNFEPGAGKHKFEQGRKEALEKEQELLERLKKLPDGEQKAVETKQMISIIHNYAGYREYPKYAIVSSYFIYKQALLREAERLVQVNILREKEDIYYLNFQEFREVVETQKLDYETIRQLKDQFTLYERLAPPRVITSDGEVITGKYKRGNLPANAIPGLPVSAGMIEGRAHIIFNIEDADIKDGDILVTPFTDPSWTPLFVSIKGLVTEVGGLMTHGAVIAREYGLPAVVGVENATKLIKNGQRIRVHGTEGYVEIL